MSSDRPVALEAMVRRFKPYPAYKESGVEWLGKIPAHWEVRRLKTFAEVQLSNVDKKSVEGEEPVKLCNYVDVYYNERITADLDFMPATATPDQIRRFSLRRGDVLITKDSESWTDIAVPALVAEDLPGVLAGYHLAHIRPGPECDGAFLAYAFAAIGPRHQFHVNANGITRFGLSGDAIRTALFAVPPLEEQRGIVAFLQRETTRIDTLVAKKQRLLELLQERRSALITRAVTKGLDPKVPVKDSGVKWLGKMPAHWKVRRLKTFADVQLSNVDKKSVENEEPIRLCNYVDVYYNERITSDLDFMHATATPDQIRRFSLRRGDVLITKDSESWTDIAVPALVAEDLPGVLAGYHLAHIRPGPECDGAFLAYAFAAAGLQDQFHVGANGITRFGLSGGVIRTSVFPLPPMHEQHMIAEYLERETGNVDVIVARIRVAIEQLREFRATLISAAVTGQIDVREEVA